MAPLEDHGNVVLLQLKSMTTLKVINFCTQSMGLSYNATFVTLQCLVDHANKDILILEIIRKKLWEELKSFGQLVPKSAHQVHFNILLNSLKNRMVNRELRSFTVYK
jgi:hypothetical protein